VSLTGAGKAKDRGERPRFKRRAQSTGHPARIVEPVNNSWVTERRDNEKT